MVKASKITKTKSIKTKIEPPKIISSRSFKAVVSPAIKSVGISPKISPTETRSVNQPVLVKKSAWQIIAWGRIFAGLLVTVVLVSGLTWLFGGKGLVVNSVKDGQLSEKQQTLILAKIAKHIQLPTTAYQIVVAADPSSLKALSPFYNQVKAGDVVVVYDNFALIFDERADILVNATMLNQQ